MQFVSSPSAQRSRSKFAIQLFRALAGKLNLFLLGVRDGFQLASRYRALARLSDHALAKRGLKRGDIMQAVLDDRNWLK